MNYSVLPLETRICHLFSTDNPPYPCFSIKSVHFLVVTMGGREGDHSGRCYKLYWLGPAQNSTDEVENYLV